MIYPKFVDGARPSRSRLRIASILGSLAVLAGCGGAPDGTEGTDNGSANAPVTAAGNFAPTTLSDARAYAEKIARHVARVSPSSMDGAVRVGVSEQPTFFNAHTDKLAIRVPKRSTGVVELARAGADEDLTLRIALPTANTERDAVVAQDGTVTYQNALTATDVAVQPFDIGVRIQTVFHDASAPTEIEYAVLLPEGAQMLQGEDGSVLLLHASGTPIGGAAAPWAKDSNEQEVPTHYEIRGQTLVQIVSHQDAAWAYPIVADPWLGIDLISSASWVGVFPNRQMRVVPTTWAKLCSGLLPSQAGWDELAYKYRFQLFYNLGSMRNQYLCHQVFNFGGTLGGRTWDLEENRPDVGLARFIAGRCNPGDGGS